MYSLTQHKSTTSVIQHLELGTHISIEFTPVKFSAYITFKFSRTFPFLLI